MEVSKRSQRSISPHQSDRLEHAPLRRAQDRDRVQHERRTVVVHNFQWDRIIYAIAFLILSVGVAVS